LKFPSAVSRFQPFLKYARGRVGGWFCRGGGFRGLCLFGLDLVLVDPLLDLLFLVRLGLQVVVLLRRDLLVPQQNLEQLIDDRLLLGAGAGRRGHGDNARQPCGADAPCYGGLCDFG
jgi:hypothetical protein